MIIPSATNVKRTSFQRRRKSTANKAEELRNEVRNGSLSLAEAHLAHVYVCLLTDHSVVEAKSAKCSKSLFFYKH